MKILAINGSYRVNGNTVRIIKQVAARMGEIASRKGEVLEFEIVHLGHHRDFAYLQKIGYKRSQS